MTGFAAPSEAADHAPLDQLAAAALAAFGLGHVPGLRLVNLSENATYRADDPHSGQGYALRICRQGYHDRGAIASELAWLAALRNDGVAITPVPVAGPDGDLIQTITHPALARPRHAVLFKWESGSEPSADTGPAMFQRLGAIAAGMHAHASTWRRPAGFQRHTWDFDTSLGDTPNWGRWRDGIGLDPPTTALFARTVAAVRRRLERFGMGPERFGLIHADMRLANLLVDGDEVKILDFDDCGFGWHLYDAATAVSFFEHEARVPELMDAWVAGYRTVGDLPDADAAEIPTFVVLRRLILIAWIGSRRETELARGMGADYTASAAGLCESYLTGFA